MSDLAEPNRPFDSFFEPYAMEIGFLLRAWNDLQEKLADLFQTVLNDGTGFARPIWYAVPVDRFQRQMLKAAAEHRFGSNAADDKAILGEIIWILERANTLGSQRDAAAHAPVSLLMSEPFEFISRHFHGNPSAKSLKRKKLLGEFRLYRKRAIVLQEHAQLIEQYIGLGLGRWTFPKRPSWPESSQTQPAKSRRSLPGAGRPRQKRNPSPQTATR